MGALGRPRSTPHLRPHIYPMCLSHQRWSMSTQNCAPEMVEMESSMGEEEEGDDGSECSSSLNIAIWAHYFTNKTHVRFRTLLEPRTQGLHAVNNQTQIQIFFHHKFLTRNITYMLAQLTPTSLGGGFFLWLQINPCLSQRQWHLQWQSAWHLMGCFIFLFLFSLYFFLLEKRPAEISTQVYSQV